METLITERYSKSNKTTLRVYPAGLSTDSRALCPVISVLAPSGNDVSVVSLLLEYRVSLKGSSPTALSQYSVHASC